MRIAAASAASFVIVVVALRVRGADDWSPAFAIFWFGLLGLAVILGITGLVIAIASTGKRAGERWAIAALSLVAPVAALFFAYVISVLADYAD